MRDQNILKIVLAILLLGFIWLAVTNVQEQREVKLQNNLELKSKEAKLIELNNRYDQVLKQKTTTEQEKYEQQNKIEELEADKKRLEKDLQVKLERKRVEEKRLAEASQNAINTVSGTSTVYAAEKPVERSYVALKGCDSLRVELAKHGIVGADQNAAINIAMKESTCNQAAVNPSSGACNVFQEYSCGKWGGRYNLSAHIRGADSYAKSVYGGWQGAWSRWQNQKWW